MENQQLAGRFKALADETRLKVVQILTTEKRCACQILEVFKISQSTLSHHMKRLVESGLVIAEKEGKWVYYRLNEDNVNDLKVFFDTIGTRTDPVRSC
ncbi:MAG: ArsR family transcriptional regulator [Acholeplasmataceae bacterium]|nr:MAG: ArsR family transcriptional regulator [Acholeplasmataceae bacterium]